MSQKMRASGALGSPHGSTSNVLGSGIASTSASWMREKPSIDEPSNVIPSIERVLQLGGADREALQVAEDVGEPQPHQSDAAVLHAAQDVVPLLFQHVVAHLLSLSAGSLRRHGRNSNRWAETGPFRRVTTASVVRTRRYSALQTVSTIRRATMYGSMLAFGRRSSR